MPKKCKVVVAYHSWKEGRMPISGKKAGCPYLVMKIQGEKPAINGLYRVGMWLDEKNVGSLGKFADLTVIIGK